MTNIQSLEDLSKIIQYDFQKIELLREAMTHPSYKNEHNISYDYQRLEFLGDSVLSLIITEMLLHYFPVASEGDLAKRRVALVCGENLAKIAQAIGLGSFIIMSASEISNYGRENINNLENAIESLIGAIYIDGGIDSARYFVKEHWLGKLLEMSVPPEDPKSSLQELLQRFGRTPPKYSIIAKTGSSHAPIFDVEVAAQGIKSFRAQASSKKLAEREAADLMLKYLISSSILE